MVDDIYFWGCRSRGRVDGTYLFLSNFYQAPFTLHGKRYETVEHYFQSMKHRGTDLEEQVRTAKKAREAKRLAWSRDPHANWEQVKENVMLEALRAKFSQNPDLAQKLLGTGNARLHEDSPKVYIGGLKGKTDLEPCWKSSALS